MKKTAMVVLLCFSLLIPSSALSKRFERTDMPGGDLTSFDESNANLCEMHCKSDPWNCTAWTYAKPGTRTNPGTMGHCWLKRYPSGKVANNDCTSGVVGPHIVGIDIACDTGKVYAWYSNGMVSMGSITDLAHTNQPHPYTMPSQHAIKDIQAISISTKYVFTYYNDGTFTRGDGQHLASKDIPYPVRNGKVLYPTYKLPHGKKPSDIVGISHACVDSNAYVWFKDGTGIRASSGDISKPDKNFTYRVPPGKKFTDIVGMGISRWNVVTWYTDGTVSDGTAEDLASMRTQKYHYPYE